MTKQRNQHKYDENDTDSVNVETTSSEGLREFNAGEEFDVIDIVNKLQDKLNVCGHTLNVPLPQIVVIGSQSSGKSSTLEGFVGKEFLPRGTGTVTRRPIVVQLIPSNEEYGVFLHKSEERFTDFSEIKREIVRATEEECGPTGFSRNPISLRIHSPRVLKLTVVDLPGIIKNAVENQQEEDIEVVRSMNLDFIKEENCIILAVTPAGEDIASSHALELARLVDPERKRTVGVLTKLDLMDEGTNCRKTLENNEIKLNLGWVGVMNRSQKEVIEGRDLNYILEKEREWFRRSEHYCHIAYRMGSPYLQKLLQKILRNHIKKWLPSLHRDMSQKLSRFKKELKEIEILMGSGPNAKENFMTKLIQKFNNDITVKIMGYSELVPSNKITYGAHINCKFYTEIPNFISQSLIPNEKDLAVLIVNLNGMRNSISVPSLAVDAICRNLIERFKDPMDSSVDCVSQVLLSAVAESAAVVDNYPSLKNELLYQVRSWIEEETGITQDRLRSHVDTEMFYINFGHPDFDATACDPSASPAGPIKVWERKEKKQNSPSAEEEIDILTRELQEHEHMQKYVKFVTELVLNYLKIVHKNVLDVTIKYIAYFLVKKVLDRINNDLVTTMLNIPNKASLKEDYENDYKAKEELKRACSGLTEALNAIRNF